MTLALLLLASAAPLAAQTLDVGDVREEYLRVLQLTGEADLGSFTIRPHVFREGAQAIRATEHPWLSRVGGVTPRSTGSLQMDPLRVRTRVFANSSTPFIENDGFVWQGKGLTTALQVGTTLQWKGLRVTLEPSIAYTQNSDFDLAPVEVAGQPVYAYPWRAIDLPQRFGADAFWMTDLGQSEVRLSGKGVTAGFGTRTRWWGPALRNAIVMSNNAGGFPHAFLGTRGPRRVGIGTIEASWTFGRLSQSDYFELPVDTDRRFHTGLVATFSPDLLPGLSLGLTRAFYGAVPPDGLHVGDAFLVLQGVTKESLFDPTNPTGDDDKDQLLSVFWRWVLPESGFETYGEWARNDHSGNVTDFVLEPEHSQAYTLGLQKAVALPRNRRVSLRAEVSHLEREATFRVRASPVYYAHHIVAQGYTHRGQVVGAAIGPGGNQQHIGGDYYAQWGRAGLMFQRRVIDNDAYFDWAPLNGANFDKHDVALDAGASATVFLENIELGGQFVFTRELNRYFGGPNVSNVHLGVTARWRAPR